MRLSQCLLIFLLAGFSLTIQAQDIHFTHFTFSPLTINPANTGDFEGTFRIGGIYRDQFRSINSFTNPFQTPNIYVDAPIIKGFGKKDWVGIGLNFYNDAAGTAKLTTTGLTGSLAYHLALDKKGKTYISLGGQYGFISKKIGDDFRFESDILGGTPNSNPDRDELTNGADGSGEGSYADINGGIKLSTVLSKTADMEIGFGVYHINTPNYEILGNDQEDLPIRMNVHALMNADISKKLRISPQILYQQIKTSNNLNLQAILGYYFNKTQDVTLNFGLGYRFADAASAELLLGMDYKQFRFGGSYDINLSGLDEISNNSYGFELALSYIGKIYKTPVVKPVILCPRF